MKFLLSSYRFFVFSFLVSLCLFLLSANTFRDNVFIYRKASTFDIKSNTYITNTSPEIDIWLKDKMSKLSLEEKVAQMFIFRAKGQSITDNFKSFLEKTKPGGLIFLGDNISPNVKNFTNEIAATNSKLPYFFAIDEEGGEVKRFPNDANPGAKVLDNFNQNDFCNIYKDSTQLLKINGMNLNFGVIADVGWDKSDFIYSRAFSNSPQDVAQKARMQIQCSREILTTVKHFPGHGRTQTDSHKSVPIIDLSYNDWLKSEAIPFLETIKEFPDMIMVGHLNFPKIDNAPATLSKIQIENLRKLGFDGVVITDDMQMLANGGLNPIDSLTKAVLAGNDILLYVSNPIDPIQMIQKVIDMVNSGQISQSRIDKSLERILRLKFRV